MKKEIMFMRDLGIGLLSGGLVLSAQDFFMGIIIALFGVILIGTSLRLMSKYNL